MTVIAWEGKPLASDKRRLHAGLIATTTEMRGIGKVLVEADGCFSAPAEVMAWSELPSNRPDSGTERA